MKYHRITITLLEPFCCAHRPLEGNETITVPWIPATTLRGAAAWKLSVSGYKEHILDAMLGGTGPRWSPAWPMAPKRPTETIIPTPACWVRSKDENPPGICNLFDAEDRQWLAVKAPFFGVNEFGYPQREVRPAAETKMRNALDYERQASREAALYARAELPEESTLSAWLEATDEAALPLDALAGEVILGKRRTAGNGKSNWKIELNAGVPPWKCVPYAKAAGRVRIQLMTDAIGPCRHGGMACGLLPGLLAHAMNIEPTNITKFSAFTARGPVFGWSQKWGLPREQALAIRAGSVGQFGFDGLSQERQTEALAKLADGIGIRRAEGFGIVAVNPSWLYRDSVGPEKDIDTLDPPKSAPPPGLNRDEGSALRLRLQMERFPFENDAQASRAVTLAAHSTRMRDIDEVTEFLKTKGWEPLKAKVADFREKLPGATIQDLQYWLRAAEAAYRIAQLKKSKEQPHA